jgi:hypothetical protein
MRRIVLSATFLGALLISATILAATAQQASQSTAQPSATQDNRAQRLILKDGTYQNVTKWEVRGSRLRYFSAERFDWEELPKDMVDWDATEKFNRSGKLQTEQDAKVAAAEEARERTLEEEANPQVAPGLKLPASGGVFLLDKYNNAPQLDELVQTGSEVNKQTSKNIMRAVINPVATAKQSIEIPGTKARVQSHVTIPAIFINVDQAESDLADTDKRDLDQTEGRYRIVKLEVKKTSRELGSISISMIGKVKEKENYIVTRSEPMSGGWVKISPAAPLPPGEYAVVEVLGPKQLNTYVWDFGVNTNAPANPSAWKPDDPKNTQTGTDKSPVLDRRPKP